ncbi:hypothetical protein [Hymenobacter tenuis]
MFSLLYLAVSISWLLWQHPLALAGPERVYGTSLQLQANPYENPLFTTDEALPFTLLLPLEAILKDRGPTPTLHAATLLYQDAAGHSRTLIVQVRVRGNRRKDPTVCDFPPLLIRFPQAEVEATPFGKVKELKLTTHCQADHFVVREYLVYKLYNLLTTISFRARLCRVTYQDSNNKRKPSVHHAFLLEEATSLAQRNNATIVPKPLAIGMQHTHQKTMAMLAFFQFMIGNTDWSVPYRHNIRLLSLDKSTPSYPVPYDFDYSGLVMTPYAVPPQQLGITSVRQRLFRGYSFPEEIYAETRTLFNARRTDFYNVYLKCPYISEEEKTFATRFLDEFYKTINDPKDFERSIGRVGRRNQKQYVNIKGLE